jgi:hypothetical protein
MGGSAISLLGDQFTIVALPWLVLRLTGDTVALGTVLALIGVPRACSSWSAAPWSTASRRSAC